MSRTSQRRPRPYRPLLLNLLVGLLDGRAAAAGGVCLALDPAQIERDVDEI